MLIILNGGSGSVAEETAQQSGEIKECFAAKGVQAHIVEPSPDKGISSLVHDGIRAGENVIVAAGGDGTVSAVAAELVGTGITLGVLPLGTLNHFAKDLRIPLELSEAVNTIVDGRRMEVDAGEVNGRIFINNSSLGIYPRIVSRREAQQQRLARGKWPAFLWATLHAFRRFPFLDLRITVGEEQLLRRTAFLFVGNNEYQIAGFKLGGRASLDRSKLGLYLTHRTGRLGLFRLALHALFGRVDQAKDFDVLTVQEAVIETRKRRLLVATDGEVTWMQTPLRYRTRPHALCVLVPPANPAA